MGMYSQRVEDAGFSLVAPKTESAFEYYPHSSASEAILFGWLLNHKVSRPVGLSIASIAAAHHGVPSTKPGVAKAGRAMAKYSAGWKAAHKEILDKIAELTGFNEVLQQITKPRHLGFSGKVVIIDEAHSYDVYMNEYLAVATQWLARYGCSVIIMSATLPTAQRQALASAYAKGLNVEEPTIPAVSRPQVMSYPAQSRPWNS